MDGPELREVGAGIEVLRRQAVDARHATVLKDDQVPAMQPRELDGGITLRGQIAVRRESEKAALLGGVVPADDLRQRRHRECGRPNMPHSGPGLKPG